MSNENKPIVQEVFADNGEHSHWTLINPETGVKLWSEEPAECKAMGHPVSHPQGEPKADEEILNTMLKMSWDNEYAEDGVISKSDALKLASVARASERAQMTYLDSYVEEEIKKRMPLVPQCLQECRLKQDEIDVFVNNDHMDEDQIANAVQNSVLRNVSALLYRVKGLPTKSEKDHFLKVMANELFADDSEDAKLYGSNGIEWMEERASLLLLQRDEAHKAEVKVFVEWCVKNYDWHFVFWQSREEGMGGIEYSTSELFDLFMKEKEGRNE